MENHLVGVICVSFSPIQWEKFCGGYIVSTRWNNLTSKTVYYELTNIAFANSVANSDTNVIELTSRLCIKNYRYIDLNVFVYSLN